MKKKLFILPGILFLAVILNAQIPTDIGFKAGLSIPNLTSGGTANPISSGYSSLLGVDGAVHVEFHLSKHLSIQPQLEYSPQGGKKKGVQAFAVPADMVMQFPVDQVPPYLYANYNSEAQINYLVLPILIKYRFDIGKYWGIYTAAGPFASMVISAKNITTGSSKIFLDEQQTQPLTAQPQSFDKNENIKSDLHPFNAGISAHLGIEYNLAKGRLFIEGGGNYGLVNIQKDAANGQNKTGAAVINLGYQIKLSKK